MHYIVLQSVDMDTITKFNNNLDSMRRYCVVRCVNRTYTFQAFVMDKGKFVI